MVRIEKGPAAPWQPQNGARNGSSAGATARGGVYCPPQVTRYDDDRPPEPTDPSPPSIWLDPASPGTALRHGTALLVVSLATAGFAVAFRGAASAFYEHAFGAGDVVASFQRLPRALRVVTVTVGATLAGLVGLVSARGGGSQGVGGVMEAVALGTGRISMRASLRRAVGCWMAIVTGSSIGREGPIIQVGGAIGGAIATRTRMSPDRARVLIAAGTAAGFAAAYNTPLAAVLFVLEIVTSVVTVDVVLATVLATAASTAVTRIAIGGGPIYGQRAFSLGSDADLALYLVLGALAGVVGAGFSTLLSASERLFARRGARPPLAQAIGGVAVGGIAVFLPQVTGNGYEAINGILGGAFALEALLVLLVAKAVATGASVGSGIPGGAFTPSLFLGAALGGSFGDVWKLASPSHASAVGACALVGMAALCAATTHAPLMAPVLVFELSGDYSIVLPLLVATGTATVVSKRIRPSSVYMEEIERRGAGWDMTWSGRRVRGRTPPERGGLVGPDRKEPIRSGATVRAVRSVPGGTPRRSKVGAAAGLGHERYVHGLTGDPATGKNVGETEFPY